VVHLPKNLDIPQIFSSNIQNKIIEYFGGARHGADGLPENFIFFVSNYCARLV
jgi:hypothetical protein